ncbi:MULTISPECIES: hypothetical protein [Brevibacterium]|uniref:ABC transporter permease n=2 Tax=Brevibacterium TaxID=1696 RepID=A0ABP9U5N0_9MICO
MRSLLFAASALSGGRPRRLLLWPLLAGLSVFVLSLVILAPALAQFEKSLTTVTEPADQSAPPPPVDSKPSYSVAVGIDDEITEMPAIQSAKVDFLSFSEEYFTQLKTGAVVDEFGTEERTLSPDGARAQVEDGTSVLAVILPKQLTPTVIDDIRAYSAGTLDRAPTYTITIVAGPQALSEDRFVVRKYEDQVMRQAGEYVSNQIRTVAGKLTCDPSGASDCPRSPSETAKAFERPFTTAVEEVSGPAPVDTFTSPSAPAEGMGQPTAQPEPTAAPTAEATDPAAASAEESSHGSPIWFGHTWVPAVLIALGFGAVTVALTASFVVNRAAGLSLVLVGPWRSMRTQRPFPRQALLSVKLLIGVVGVAVLGLVATIAVTGLGFFGVGAFPLLRILAVLCFLTLLAAVLVSIVLTVNDAVGTLFGALAAVAALIWVIAQSGATRAFSLSGSDADLGMVTELLLGQGNRWTVLSYALPTAVGLIFALVLALVVGLTATYVYDRARSTKIDLG